MREAATIDTAGCTPTRQIIGRRDVDPRPPGKFEASVYTPTFVVDIRSLRRPPVPHPTDELWGLA